MSDAILVIGAGPAGLSAAASLAQAGHPVRLVDRSRDIGRRKLCGEFLSGDAGQVLQDLGCDIGADCPAVDELLVSAPGGRSASVSQPGLGWGCTRERLRQRLRHVCQAQGVEIIDGKRVAEKDVAHHRLVIWATGQTGAARAREGTGRRGRWLAVAVHGLGRLASRAVQLHMLGGGYAGLGMVEGGRANLCALLPAPGHACDPLSYLLDMCRSNALLDSSIRNMFWDSSTVAVQAGLNFDPGRVNDSVLRIGDAGTAPVPLLGQGLAAALQGGQMMAQIVDRDLRTNTDPRTPDAAGIAAEYRRLWRQEFGPRFRWGRWMQRAATGRFVARLAVVGLHWRPQFGQSLIRATRGALPEVALNSRRVEQLPQIPG